MRLNEIQDHFATTLLDEQGLEGRPSDFQGCFESDNIALEDRFAVYRNNVSQSLKKVLSATYPAIEKLVGDAFMAGMSMAYIREHPPQKGNLNLYGGTFPAFIDSYEAAASVPYLADVARLEWLVNEAYYARDDKPLALETLQNLPPGAMDDIILSVRDSVALMASSYPVRDIRRFCQSDDDNAAAPDMTSGPQYLLVHRPCLTVNIETLDEAAYRFLEFLMRGETISQAAVTIMARFPNADITRILQKFLEMEIFAPFNQESTGSVR